MSIRVDILYQRAHLCALIRTQKTQLFIGRGNFSVPYVVHIVVGSKNLSTMRKALALLVTNTHSSIVAVVSVRSFFCLPPSQSVSPSVLPARPAGRCFHSKHEETKSRSEQRASERGRERGKGIKS